MAFDANMQEIFDAFREECAEGLDVMESGLLSLDPGAVDLDTLGAVFRAAHSIKGGAATFGLLAVAEFTHDVEALLDQLRSGERPASRAIVDTLLSAVDALRRMLEAEQADDAAPGEDLLSSTGAAPVLEGIRAVLASSSAEAWAAYDRAMGTASPAPSEAASASARRRRWTLDFGDAPGLFASDVDLVRLFEELARLGELRVDCDPMGLPPLGELDPQVCHLLFRLELVSTEDRARVDECLAWLDESLRPSVEVEALDPDDADPVPTEPAAADDGATGVRTHGVNEGATDRSATHPIEAGRTEAGRTEAGRTEGGRTEAGRTEGGPTEAVAAVRPPMREAGSIRVPIEKVDALLDLVGELVITQSMLRRCGDDLALDGSAALQDGLDALERYTRELQERAMGIRMLPIGVSFSRIPRLVHDLSARLSKLVDVRFSGEQTELDKHVLEKMSDPLVHLVRNALDHGIESPAERIAAGKPERGTLELSAAHENGSILIRIEDDGAGLDRERILARARARGLVPAGAQPSVAEIDNLIFEPGFSTSDTVNDISGRGVGMDVVHNNISALGGRLEITSEPGRGTTLSIHLPLTLAILDGQLVRVGSDVFVFPLLSIVETVQVAAEDVRDVLRTGSVYRIRDRWIPVARLRDLFELPSREASQDELLVVVEREGRPVGFFVDELREQQQVVVKSLEANYRRVDGLAGATILGDGRVALILDCPSLARQLTPGGEGPRPTERELAA